MPFYERFVFLPYAVVAGLAALVCGGAVLGRAYVTRRAPAVVGVAVERGA
jgi:hypothetical protein